MENFKIEVDADGVALVTFDVPGRSMNTLTGKVIEEFPQVIERIKIAGGSNDIPASSEILPGQFQTDATICPCNTGGQSH